MIAIVRGGPAVLLGVVLVDEVLDGVRHRAVRVTSLADVAGLDVAAWVPAGRTIADFGIEGLLAVAVERVGV